MESDGARARVVLVLLASLLGAAGCSTTDNDRTPEGALRVFVDAVRDRDQTALWRILSKENKETLERRAAEVGASTGGAVKVKPEDLLIPQSVELSGGKLTRVEEGDNRVVMRVGQGEEGATFTLVREEEGWRIHLPLDGPLGSKGSGPGRSGSGSAEHGQPSR